MVECTKTQRLPIVQEMVLPNITKPFKSDLSFLVDCMQQPNVPVVDVIHKTTPYNLFNYLNISIINEICKKFAYLFVQYFHYNPGRFSVQIDYIHTSFPCLPAGIECSSIRLAVIKGYHAT